MTTAPISSGEQQNVAYISTCRWYIRLHGGVYSSIWYVNLNYVSGKHEVTVQLTQYTRAGYLSSWSDDTSLKIYSIVTEMWSVCRSLAEQLNMLFHEMADIVIFRALRLPTEQNGNYAARHQGSRHVERHYLTIVAQAVMFALAFGFLTYAMKWARVAFDHRRNGRPCNTNAVMPEQTSVANQQTLGFTTWQCAEWLGL